MISVQFCNDESAVNFDITDSGDLHVEDIVILLCNKIKIRPLCQVIFGLQVINVNNKGKHSLGYWLPLCKKLSELKDNIIYQFRIRFIPHYSDTLKKLDSKSYKYLFYQVRYDFLMENLPEHTQKPTDALGLVVTDILHHILLHEDKKIKDSDIYKKVKDLDIYTFMPKNLRTFPNKINVKSTTENLLKQNSERYINRGPEDIRYHYLDKVDEIGRPGGFEKYPVQLHEDSGSIQVDLFIDPYHETYPGLYYKNSKKVTEPICTIEELVYVSIRKQDLTVETSWKNGTPCYFSLNSLEALESLVSCLSGYYRLMKIWTFDLCKELPTPSLSYLKSNKCHGPVGSDFVLKKFKRKGATPGTGILRMSSLEYDVYKLSVFTKDDHPPAEHIILQTENKVHLKGSDEKHDTLQSLMTWEITTNYNDFGLKKLLPPSECDDADQLLLYASFKKKEPAPTLGPRPIVMNMEEFIMVDKKALKGKFSNVYHVKWYQESGDHLAVKVPKLRTNEMDNYLNCMNKFLSIEGDCVVKVFGITLSPMALVMEYLPLGPLDIYLKQHAKNMNMVELVEASSYLAKALWDLHSKDLTHHKIRCHNILVADHTAQRFKVKLGDPGKVEYTLNDIHWIPREHLMHPSSALTDPQDDIWAFATTLWEIFSIGEAPLVDADIEQVRALYSQGFLLHRPDRCPKDIYQVMVGCWHPDPQCRKRPQAIMRDIKQIFCYIFNSRRENQYQEIQLTYANLNTDNDDSEDDVTDDDTSTLVSDEQLSVSTQTTTLTRTDGSVTEVKFEQIMDYPLIPPEIAIPGIDVMETYSMVGGAKKAMTLKEFLVPSPWGTQSTESSDPSRSLELLELNNSSIEILKRIGKGNYGYVFKGKRIYRDRRVEIVALKRLQSVGNTNDFKKEMEIMKNLKHENIVQFHCLVESDQEGSSYQYMVMEYLPLGSMQDYLLCNKQDKHLLSDKKLLDFAMDIAKGMDYLESQQIIHRDLAARNVLVASEDHVKITDFGLAQRPNQGNYYIIRTLREMPIRWYALESIERGKFSHKTDVWSYGVTLWEMFTRGLDPDLPNDGPQLIQTLKNGTRLICKAPCEPFIYSDLIRPCWDEDPAMRPEFTKLINIILEIKEKIA